VTGELSAFNGVHEFKKYESLLVIDDGTPQIPAVPAEAACAVPLDGTWKIVRASENCITLDHCDYYFDGKLEEEHGYILNAMYRAMALNRPVQITCDFKVQARYVPEQLYLVMEMPEQFDAFVNGKPVCKTDCGYFRDKSFRKLNISGLLTTGDNIITLKTNFAQSPVVYENMAKGMCHESEKNKLTFDMELEQIYLVGDFAVETPGAFTELARKACRYGGAFVIAPPKTEVTLNHLERQGFPFFAGALTVEKKFTAADTPMMLDFAKAGINTITAAVNGHPVDTFLWEPFRADVTHLLQPGENILTLTLKNNLRNMQGPLHLEIGESFGVGPGAFYKEPCIWNNRPTEGRWNDDYCFVEVSLTNRR
jgi:hypothetical protein